MFFKTPRVDIWKAVQFTPPLKPDTIFTTIVPVVNSHAVFMRVVPSWYPCFTIHMLVVLRAVMHQDSALVQRWWFRLAYNTLGRV